MRSTDNLRSKEAAFVLKVNSAISLGAAITLIAGTAGFASAAVRHAPPAGGSLTIAFSQEPDTLNPAQTGLTAVAEIDRNIFDTLVWETPAGKITPDLATRWTITNGGKTYTFYLRHGVTFQDGTPFNAQAVAFNFNYIEAPSTHSISAIGDLGPFKSAKALGPYTVQLNLKTPYAPLLTYLGQPTLGMQSPTAIKKGGVDYGLHPVGTGPFEVKSYTPNSKLVLVRNPRYHWAPPALHRNGPAYLKQITYDIVGSGQSRIDELLSGQAQVADAAPPLFYKRLGAGPQYKQFPVDIPGAGEYAVINNSKWPTNSVAVRKAILYFINRKGLVELADQGVFPVIWGPLQPGTLGYDPAFNGMYPYAPAKGAAILKAAGWKKVHGIWTKDGKQLSLVITNPANVIDLPALSQAIQSYLEKAGMKVKIEQFADAAWHAANVKGVENIEPLEFSSVDPSLLQIEFTPGQYFNWSKYSNPTVTRLLNEAGADTNPKSRLQLYFKAETILMDQAVMIPEHMNEDLVLIKSNLKGVTVYQGGYMDYYSAYLAK